MHPATQVPSLVHRAGRAYQDQERIPPFLTLQPPQRHKLPPVGTNKKQKTPALWGPPGATRQLLWVSFAMAHRAQGKIKM